MSAAAYTVLPLSPSDVGWLESENLEIPPVVGPSRFPTIRELRHAVSLLSGFQVDSDPPDPDGEWEIRITREGSTDEATASAMKVTDYQGEDTPHGFWYTRGWPPLVLATAKQLATATGPLVILSVKEGAPVIVSAHSDVATLLGQWRHTAAG